MQAVGQTSAESTISYASSVYNYSCRIASAVYALVKRIFCCTDSQTIEDFQINSYSLKRQVEELSREKQQLLEEARTRQALEASQRKRISSLRSRVVQLNGVNEELRSDAARLGASNLDFVRPQGQVASPNVQPKLHFVEVAMIEICLLPVSIPLIPALPFLWMRNAFYEAYEKSKLERQYRVIDG